METKKNSYKFTIAKDKAGHMMLSALALPLNYQPNCGEIDKEALNHAKIVEPTEFIKTLVKLIDQAKK